MLCYLGDLEIQLEDTVDGGFALLVTWTRLDDWRLDDVAL